jgi:protocatechuate 3,4-dioxygenase beta subunit
VTRPRSPRLLAFTAAVALAAVFSVALAAQSKKEKQEDANARSLEGIVLDQQGNAVLGAVVKLEDMHTLQVRSFFTKEDGQYHFSGLKTEIEYQVRADHDAVSSGWKRLSIFDARKVANITLKLDKKLEAK